MLASIGADQWSRIKALPSAFRVWRSRRTVAKEPTADHVGCENRRLTLVGMRHKSSEMPPGPERDKALTLCDEMDALAITLWPEAT